MNGRRLKIRSVHTYGVRQINVFSSQCSVDFNKNSNLQIRKMQITSFPPISTHHMRLFLVVLAYADASYMVQFISHDELNEFLSPENSPFYIVKWSIYRKMQSICSFKLQISLPKASRIEKLTYRSFIIHIKVSKNYANSI